MTSVARTDRDEIARLRSIIHRAESAVLSYQTRDAIGILGELNAASDADDESVATKWKHRTLWNRRGDEIDEIVIDHPESVHIEQMGDECWWVGITLPDGGYCAGNFFARSKKRMTFKEQEMWGFDWDRDDEHIQPGGAA